MIFLQSLYQASEPEVLEISKEFLKSVVLVRRPAGVGAWGLGMKSDLKIGEGIRNMMRWLRLLDD